MDMQQSVRPDSLHSQVVAEQGDIERPLLVDFGWQMGQFLRTGGEKLFSRRERKMNQRHPGQTSPPQSLEGDGNHLKIHEG